jgi:hypothetical protein
MAPATTRIEVGERRARLAVRHHLAPAVRARKASSVARAMVALHATDPASVFLAAWARMRDPSVAEIETALYDERALVRTLGMRRTMFVVPIELMPVVQAACTRAIAAKERRLLVELLTRAGIAGDAEGWLREVEDSATAALAARKEAFANELSGDEPRLREQVTMAPGTSYETRQSISSRVLYLLAADGRIVRGRPRGSWTSSQWRWAPAEAWLPAAPEWSIEEAQRELVRRWLGAFGPGTAEDLKWWTGWTARATRSALEGVGAVEVDLGDATGLVLADDVAPVSAPEPWAALLPALDPTVMGWSGRAWYLGDHGSALFDRSGNAGPTVWWDGRIVGGWAQRQDGDVVFRLLEDVGTDAVAQVEAVAQRLRAWLGVVRLTPRFRTPLERELSA